MQEITRICALLVLAVALWQARRLSSDVVSNIDKFGDDKTPALSAARKAMTNFYLAFAAVVVLVAGIFDKVGDQLFGGLLVAVLTGLGVKIVADAGGDKNT